MSYQIHWTEEAEKSFNNNVEYLSQTWDQATIVNFLDRVDKVSYNIGKNPDIYPVFNKEERVHRCVVNRHITLFYRVSDKDHIDFLTFWNTHRDPNDLTLGKV